MSLKLKMVQKEIEEGELAQAKVKIKDMGFDCDVTVDWTTFQDETEIKRVYNYAYSDVVDCLSSSFKNEQTMKDAFNSGVKKIELCASTTENKTELAGGVLKLTVNFANNNAVSAGQLRSFLMDNL